MQPVSINSAGVATNLDFVILWPMDALLRKSRRAILWQKPAVFSSPTSFLPPRARLVGE